MAIHDVFNRSTSLVSPRTDGKKQEGEGIFGRIDGVSNTSSAMTFPGESMQPKSELYERRASGTYDHENKSVDTNERLEQLALECDPFILKNEFPSVCDEFICGLISRPVNEQIERLRTILPLLYKVILYGGYGGVEKQFNYIDKVLREQTRPSQIDLLFSVLPCTNSVMLNHRLLCLIREAPENVRKKLPTDVLAWWLHIEGRINVPQDVLKCQNNIKTLDVLEQMNVLNAAISMLEADINNITVKWHIAYIKDPMRSFKNLSWRLSGLSDELSVSSAVMGAIHNLPPVEENQMLDAIKPVTDKALCYKEHYKEKYDKYEGFYKGLDETLWSELVHVNLAPRPDINTAPGLSTSQNSPLIDNFDLFDPFDNVDSYGSFDWLS